MRDSSDQVNRSPVPAFGRHRPVGERLRREDEILDSSELTEGRETVGGA